jgi:RNA polymerase sigma-70 factor (ECF subfamily)
VSQAPRAQADAALFAEQRPRLLRLAYRMLGSVSEAEDMLQEAWLRWQSGDREGVREPAAFLTTVVTRLCLDQIKSVRARRESYVGAWLPEPLLDSQWVEPASADEEGEEISMALMLLLERLSPLERAAFLLHDAFDLEFSEVARILGRSNEAVRRLASRAREQLHRTDAKPRYAVSEQQGAELARAFRAASLAGDIPALQKLLADQAVMISDGGGLKPSALFPVVGAGKVARLFDRIAAKFGRERSADIEVVSVNGMPGYVTLEVDGTLQTTALQIEDGRITAIYITRNPEKLRHVPVPPSGTLQ